MSQQSRRLLSRIGFIACVLMSPIEIVDFDYLNQGKLLDEAGLTQNFQFGFYFLKHKGEYKFSAGRLTRSVDEVPKRYRPKLVLNNKQQIWVSNFSKKPLLGFEWQIGEHQLKLTKETATAPKDAHY